MNLSALVLVFNGWTVVALVQDRAMEGSGSRGGGRAFNVADGAKHTTFELGHIHTSARCSLGLTMRD